MKYKLYYRVVIDPIFPPPYEWPNSRRGVVPDNCFKNNKFEIIFDERNYEILNTSEYEQGRFYLFLNHEIIYIQF